MAEETSSIRERLSRRDFVRGTLSTVVSGLSLPGCRRTEKITGSTDAVLLGLYPKERFPDARDVVRLACKELNWDWLSRGDRVFVKLACNSDRPHPAVTSPSAVHAVCRELFDRGAGRVLVGDKCGIMAVYVTRDHKSGSTRDHMRRNGVLAAIQEAGAQPHFFDENDYKKGYFEATLPFEGSHWASPVYLPAVVREVDHIIYLPRLSSHLLAGYTHGLKSSIGWLRDDCRLQLHLTGDSLHEKYTEVNYAKEIRDRHRLTLTLAERVLLDAGPDDGTVAELDPRIVLASHHLANHDALSVAVLAYVDNMTRQDEALTVTYSEDGLRRLTGTTLFDLVSKKHGIATLDPVTLGSLTPVKYHRYQQGIAEDLSLSRAYEILGGVPRSIPIRVTGEKPKEDLRAFIASHNQGIFQLHS